MNNMENFGHLPYIHVFYLAWSWQIKDDWSTFWENFYTFDETVAMFPDQTSLSVLSMINESLSFFFLAALFGKKTWIFIVAMAWQILSDYRKWGRPFSCYEWYIRAEVDWRASIVTEC